MSANNPFEQLERFFERMSRQFDEAARTWESEGSLARLTPGRESMAVDLVDRDEAFVATVDLPGFERGDVTVTVADRTLRIEADREEATEEDERYVRRERRHESMRRELRLPGEIDREAVDATMQNGVLTITLPKAELEESKTIEIE